MHVTFGFCEGLITNKYPCGGEAGIKNYSLIMFLPEALGRIDVEQDFCWNQSLPFLNRKF